MCEILYMGHEGDGKRASQSGKRGLCPESEKGQTDMTGIRGLSRWNGHFRDGSRSEESLQSQRHSPVSKQVFRK